MDQNFDEATVKGFGDEWKKFDQSSLTTTELQEIFNQYFAIFPWSKITSNATGFDLGCGSGRWAKEVAPKVASLYCIDASSSALNVAKENLKHLPNVNFFHASVDSIPLADNSMDFGYSLGVLHHVPNTKNAIKACVRKLKSKAPLLLYLYYAFDNKPAWYRLLWKLSDYMRYIISRMPFPIKYLFSQIMAGVIYYPCARAARLCSLLGFDVSNMPLAAYRDRSFYVMRTDALDRFGTQLEHRFTRKEITQMMQEAGLEDISFHDGIPYWCAVGYKR